MFCSPSLLHHQEESDSFLFQHRSPPELLTDWCTNMLKQGKRDQPACLYLCERGCQCSIPWATPAGPRRRPAAPFLHPAASPAAAPPPRPVHHRSEARGNRSSPCRRPPPGLATPGRAFIRSPLGVALHPNPGPCGPQPPRRRQWRLLRPRRRLGQQQQQ
jgi:hypothetical protein